MLPRPVVCKHVHSLAPGLEQEVEEGHTKEEKVTSIQHCERAL